MNGTAASGSVGKEETTPLFVEILPKNDNNKPSQAYAEAYVGTVDPQQCGALIQRLSAALPLNPPPSSTSASSSASTTPDFSCLKRVKRTIVAWRTDDSLSESSSNGGAPSNGGSQDHGVPLARKKKRVFDSSSSEPQGPPSVKGQHVLQVLLGAVNEVKAFVSKEVNDDDNNNDASDSCIDDAIVRIFQLRRLDKVLVPARPAESEAEWKEFQRVWPSSFYPHRTTEFREKSLQLSEDDVEQMKKGMAEALTDAANMAATSSTAAIGTVVVDPATGHTVARSSAEHVLQTTPKLPNGAVMRMNPLQTSVIFAIQAVSRIERQHAQESAAMDGPDFQTGQYLCTGYDVYTTLEPSPFEAMALVHARIRRLVFGCCASVEDDSAADRQHGGRGSGGGGGGITEHGVHALPGTNHKYRAFMCRHGSSLWKACHNVAIRSEANVHRCS